MSEDSSAEAPTPKKSPSRKRSSSPRKKASKKADETPQTAGEAPQASTSETPNPAAEPAAARETKIEAPSKAAAGSGEDKGRSRGGRNRRGRQRGGNGEGRQQQSGQHRHSKPIDVKKLGKKAWHIYSTEVCEEGLRYIDETDANKLVRRSFRMAEIFLRYQQEQAETVNTPPPPPRQSRPAKSEEALSSAAAPEPKEEAAGEAEKAEPSTTEKVETPTEGVEAAKPINDDTATPEPVLETAGKKADHDEVIEPPTIDVD